MTDSDQQQGPVQPTEQRGGTAPGEAEAREKGQWAQNADEGVAPAELGSSDAPRERLASDAQLGSSAPGASTGSQEPAIEGGVDRSAGDRADGTPEGGPDLPQDAEPDVNDAASAVPERRRAGPLIQFPRKIRSVAGALALRSVMPGARLGRAELVLASALLVVLGATVYGPHVLNGGFYSDDWQSAATYRFAMPPRYTHAVVVQSHALGARPLLALAQPLPHALFGETTALHLALALALAVLVSAGFFAVLRTLGLEPLHAIIIAGLALVFPWSDSTRLWSIAGLNQIATCLYLAGVLIALRGVRLGGRRGIAAHGAALLLYVASLLTYEALAGLVVSTGMLYVVHAGGLGKLVWRRWLVDVGVAVPVLAWSHNATSSVRTATSAHALLGDLPHFAHEALSLLVDAVTPFAFATVSWLVLALAVGVRIRVRGLPDDPVARRDLRRWLLLAVVALVELAAAFGPFTGSGLHPLDEGLNNRGNIVVALPLAALVYALAALAARLLVPQPRRRLAALALTAGIAAVPGVGYTYQVRGDVIRWDQATVLQQRVLAVMRAAVPRPRSGSVIYAYGFPAVVAPGISIFSEPWDLSSAAKLAWRDPTLSAYPIVQGVRFACVDSGVYPIASTGPWDALQGGYGPAQGAAYGRAIFLDVAAGSARVIANAHVCEQASRSLRLAPLVGTALVRLR